MITHEEISRRARDIWEREGRPEGKDKEHWLQAEAELRQESTPGAMATDTALPREAMANGQGDPAKENGARKRSQRRR